MRWPLSATDLVYGVLLPAVFGAAAHRFAARLPAGIGSRYRGAVAMTGGFLLGHFLLSLGEWPPESHWHWLPYVAVMATIVGPASLANGVAFGERVSLATLTALITAWLLVPTWEDLQPSRFVYVVACTLGMALLAIALEPLSGRFPGVRFPLTLTIAFVTGAVVLALSESLRFAQMAGAGAGALVGLTLACCLARPSQSTEGLGLPYAVILGGAMLIGQAYSFSDVPLASYLLVPFAPLSLWLCLAGPLAKLDGRKRDVIHISVPFLICAIAVALAVVQSISWEGTAT